MADGPSVEQDVWQYYQNAAPGQVQVLGADLYNGTATQLRSFKTQTGTTYPLLLLGASATGGNLGTLYGTFDNYIVISRQGIVRYHAADIWPHGNRYHLNEIRACVDSLILNTTDVPPEEAPPALAVRSAPNPFAAETAVEFVNPGHAAASFVVGVHDLTGRRIATLWNGPAPVGASSTRWDGRRADGTPAAAGVYFVAVNGAGARVTRRLVLLP